MKKERILKTASDYFASYGIKIVSMSLIAETLGISKRTLYLKYGSKEELLVECIEYEIENLTYKFDNISSNSSAEDLVQICLYISQYKFTHCPAFHLDIQKYIKANESLSAFKEYFRSKIITLIAGAVTEKDFIPELDINETASMILEIIDKMTVEFCTKVLLVFIRGISTEKGISTISTMIKSNISDI